MLGEHLLCTGSKLLVLVGNLPQDVGLFSMYKALGSSIPSMYIPGVVVLSCNPSTQEAEARGSGVQGHLLLHSE